MSRELEVAELVELMKRDVDVKTIVNLVLLAEGLDIFALAEGNPDLFDQLYDECFSLVAQIEEDSR